MWNNQWAIYKKAISCVIFRNCQYLISEILDKTCFILIPSTCCSTFLLKYQIKICLFVVDFYLEYTNTDFIQNSMWSCNTNSDKKFTCSLLPFQFSWEESDNFDLNQQQINQHLRPSSDPLNAFLPPTAFEK